MRMKCDAGLRQTSRSCGARSCPVLRIEQRRGTHGSSAHPTITQRIAKLERQLGTPPATLHPKEWSPWEPHPHVRSHRGGIAAYRLAPGYEAF